MVTGDANEIASVSAAHCTPAWAQRLHAWLLPSCKLELSALDLFCGAGGLSLGFAAAGFKVSGIDQCPDSVETYTENLGSAECKHIDASTALPKADVLIAGPPCQPWSRAGKRLGEEDLRDGLAATIAAVEAVKPLAVVIENVPAIARGSGRTRLDRLKSDLKALGYAIKAGVLNAADFGVPQNRRRAFILAVGGKLPMEMPKPWATGFCAEDAVADTCNSTPEDSRFLSAGMDEYIARYEQASGCRVPRDLHFSRPARTLTVRNLAGATGDMMRLRLLDGRRRMLTVREAARLQSFPDWFQFCGSQGSQFSQIGNAVPPLLALAVARQVRDRLTKTGKADSIPEGAPARLAA